MSALLSSLRGTLMAAVLSTLALPVVAQGWGNLDHLLLTHLSTSGTAEASFWLPDTSDPAQARVALGVVYEYIPGSAGNTGIAVGVFAKQATGWLFAGKVQNVFGQNPRGAVFGPGFVELTTTMPGPNDPRCCPTLKARWRIDLSTRTSVRLP